MTDHTGESSQAVIAIIVGIVAIGAVVSLLFLDPQPVLREYDDHSSDESLSGSAFCRPISDSCAVCSSGAGWREVCASQ